MIGSLVWGGTHSVSYGHVVSGVIVPEQQIVPGLRFVTDPEAGFEGRYDSPRGRLLEIEVNHRHEARWLGLMGSARHAGPHEEGLRERGWSGDDVDRIERPVGLDIGSKTPPEIALSVLAGIVADRQGKR